VAECTQIVEPWKCVAEVVVLLLLLLLLPYLHWLAGNTTAEQ
jgi:hypothetical protein